MEKRILLLLFSFLFSVSFAYSQTREITGVVISSEDGEPVIGALVWPKDRKTEATSTDGEGRFVLKTILSTDKYLSFSSMGMKDVEAEIKPNMKVVMEVNAKLLDEVIHVAFGTAKKSAFTGSATVIKAEDITKRPVSNLANALIGQSPGLKISQTTGQPGASPTMSIRGVGSFSISNSPLIILDGSPYAGSMNGINPNDVESISILKDATSSALYGARGGNGVILITTKSAKPGTSRVNVDMKWGISKRGRIDYDYIKSPAQYYESHYKALYNYNIDKKGYSPEKAHVESNKAMLSQEKTSGGLAYNVYSYPENEYLIGADGRINPNATLGRVVGDHYLTPDNWTDELYKTSFRQEYNVSASGGTTQTSILGSFGYLKDMGMVRGSDFERYTARMRVSHQVKPWLRFGGNAMYTKTVSNGVLESSGNSSFYTAMYVAPIYPVYLRDASGNIMYNKLGKMYDYGAKADGSPVDRPVAPNISPIQQAFLDVSNTDADMFNGNGFVDITFLENFKFTFSAATTVRGARGKSLDNPYYGASTSTDGSVSVSHSRRNTLNLQQLLSYNNSFKRVHNVSILVGHEYEQNRYSYLSAKKTGLFNYLQNQELDGAINSTPSMRSYKTYYNTEGYIFRGLYDYDNKYFFQASYRRDASSNFSPKHRWGNFYSFGASYLIDKEEWFNVDWIDVLKAKISYGQQGADHVGSFLYTNRYSIENSNDELALTFSGKGVENITWESSNDLNMGIEFELFKSRLVGEIVYYNRAKKDLLMWVNVPTSMGFGGIHTNAGNMRDRGFEIDLKYTPIRTKDIRWDVNLNMSRYSNEITDLPVARKTENVEGIVGYTNGDYYYGIGLPYQTWRIKSYAGVSETGESLWYVKDPETGELSTTNKYNNASYFLKGDQHPDLMGGFGTYFNFRGFDFSMMFDYKIGGKLYDSGYASLMGVPSSSSVGNNKHVDLFKAWSPENPNSNIPRWQFDDLNVSSQSDRFLIDGSYLTLQNIQVGYTLPARTLRSLGATNIRLYVMCDNVYYWSKRKGFDPRGTSGTSYALPRSFVGGLNFEF